MNLRLLVNRAHAWLLVTARGKLGARVGGRPVLVLETHGRRSDRQRRTPVQYLGHGVELLIVASNAAVAATTDDGVTVRRTKQARCPKRPAIHPLRGQ